MGDLHARVCPRSPRRRPRQDGLDLRQAGTSQSRQQCASVALLLGSDDVVWPRARADQVPVEKPPELVPMRRVGSLQQLGLRPRWRLHCLGHRRPHSQERAVGLLAEHEGLRQGLARHSVDGAVQGPRLDREGGPGRHVFPRPAEAARRRPAGRRAVVHPQQRHGDAHAGAHRDPQQGGHVRVPRQQQPCRQWHGQGRLRERLHGRERRGRLHRRLPEAPRRQGEVRPPRPQE
mmetsp:Transcript_2404/g.4822  ORF Transcript_2404/g.4822 Transcript_2404/m.4822 type:complete len:233 (+) Transcript_2404:1060-1758(+)